MLVAPIDFFHNALPHSWQHHIQLCGLSPEKSLASQRWFWGHVLGHQLAPITSESLNQVTELVTQFQASLRQLEWMRGDNSPVLPFLHPQICFTSFVASKHLESLQCLSRIARQFAGYEALDSEQLAFCQAAHLKYNIGDPKYLTASGDIKFYLGVWSPGFSKFSPSEVITLFDSVRRQQPNLRLPQPELVLSSIIPYLDHALGELVIDCPNADNPELTTCVEVVPREGVIRISPREPGFPDIPNSCSGFIQFLPA